MQRDSDLLYAKASKKIRGQTNGYTCDFRKTLAHNLALYSAGSAHIFVIKSLNPGESFCERLHGQVSSKILLQLDFYDCF